APPAARAPRRVGHRRPAPPAVGQTRARRGGRGGGRRGPRVGRTGAAAMTGARGVPADAPVVVAARRTWVGTAGHGHRALTEVDLAAGALRATLDDTCSLGVADDPADVVLGCCTGPGGNVARVAALAAGAGVAVPGLTADRQCASGLAAVLVAAQQVRAGEARLVLAGGTERASRAPARAHRTPRGDVPLERAALAPAPWAEPAQGAAAHDAPRRPAATPAP